jgi:hypothetical protein
VVSANIEDGLFEAGYAILALVLRFYQKSTGNLASKYPPYFCFIEELNLETHTRAGPTGLTINGSCGPWQFFDFWPQSQWVGIQPMLGDVLMKVSSKKITHLFWPETYLKNYIDTMTVDKKNAAKKIIYKMPLHSVHLYGHNVGKIRISVTSKVEDLILRGIRHMPIDNIDRILRQRCAQSSGGRHLFYQEFKSISKFEFANKFD